MASLLLLFVATTWAQSLRFAVMPFDNAGGPEFEALGVGLQSMVTTDLARVDGVTVVERARLQDVLAEMKLGKSELVDPGTAAKAGRVLQATHVVVGSFTVVGDRMRLDARATEVATSEIAFEASKTGGRDWFFELEAAMVTELLGQVGAELSARDRFAIGRHTADFDAFSTFSQGVALFDQGRYAEARRTLEDASRRDPTFELVAVTLDDLQAVQERAEAKARAARVAAAEEAFVVHRQAAAREGELVEKLLAIARDDARTWQERATANQLLVTALGWGHTNHGGFSTLRRSADAFALARLGEQAYQSLWTELRPRVPEWFPVHVGPNGFFNEERGMDFVFPRNRARFFENDNHNFNLSSCPDMMGYFGQEELDMLWVPRARQLDLARDLWRAARDCVRADRYRRAMRDLAEEYQEIGRFGIAAALLQELTATTSDPDELERIARIAAEVREEAQILDRLTEGSPAWEILRFHAAKSGRTPSVDELEGLDTEALQQKLHYFIRSRFPFRAPFFVGGVPAWRLTDNDGELVSGRRTGIDEADSLRHYAQHARTKRTGPPTVMVLGGVPRTDVRATIRLDFRPADDWWTPRTPSSKREPWTPVAARPTAGLLVGLRELDTPPVCDPVSGKLERPVPTRSIGALIHEGKLVIAEVEEAYPEADRCDSSLHPLRDLEVGRILSSRPVKRDHLALDVTVKGKQITATAGGIKVRADLAAAPGGFVGLLARGDGYVELSEPDVD